MYDWLITNAEILDGSGAEAVRGDVALKDGSIAAVGQLSDAGARHTLDAAGKTLTPGFLDVHRHGDAALFRPDYGKAELAQGLTTVINGNCGMSCAPVTAAHAPEILRYLAPITGEMPAGAPFRTMNEYFRRAAEVPLRLNAGILAGGGVLRADAAGFAEGPLSGEQLHTLHTLLEEALGAGALGVSLGLGYAPECFYTTEELIRALEPLKNSGTVIAVHMRQEGDGVAEALEEMLTVARALRTPVEISHLKSIGKRNWRSVTPKMLRMITRAREEGLDVSCDVYPYTAGSTQLIHVLPPEFQSGGTEALTARLRDPGERAAMRARMESGSDFENITLLVGFENVRATGLRTAEYAPFEGKSVAEVAQAQGKDPFDALFDLLAAEHCAPSMIDFITAEEDIADILRTPFASVISDAIYPSAGLLHPRVYGMTAHLLEHFVRETHTLTLAQAVNRLTRRPADRYGLVRKGRVEPGADADLLVFDPQAVHECGTYARPDQYVRGFETVFVNGVPAIENGAFTGAAAGSLLRR
ncbi:MAG: amidohydrolase family protein [Oscillibacter sp.]|jgi:N-acyl-D-aspartate/D-glutamate deacylase|nr:amidohydrolase family protein [Oscillibacter sp.]